MKCRGILLVLLMLLSGCGNVLASQAVVEAEIAINEHRYERASALFHLASIESSSREHEALYQQSIHLMAMEHYTKAREVDKMLLTWTELNLISTESNIIKEAAINMVRQKLKNLEIEAVEKLEEGNPNQIITLIRLIEDRMGTFQMFEKEIQVLNNLRRQLEGGQI